MQFHQLAASLEEIEGLSSRLAITQKLAQIWSQLEHKEVCPRNELHARVEELPELIRHVIRRGVYRRCLAHATYLLEGTDVGIVANRIDGDV